MPQIESNSDLHHQIIRYYEICDTDYAFFWHLDSRMAMHYGYWDSNTLNLKESLWNMNRFLAETVAVNSGDHVLDAGCGVGGSCFYLHQFYGCRATGITLSKKHVENANEKAKNDHKSHSVQFEVADFCNTGFADNQFDVVWALESVCHSASKADFVKEAFRILKPGGRLVVGDFFQEKDIGEKGELLMHKWAESWAVPAFETSENFELYLKKEGFQTVSFQNITKQIERSSKKLFASFIPGILANIIFPFFGKRKNRVQRLNVWSVYWQRITLRKKLWNYKVFSAIKGQ
ncbi:MAG: methyltransferase domain-containing protein [Bacteroidetes bacterium]|nr:methyltransferase domain-containing protein [Bacteroidota bacterium]